MYLTCSVGGGHDKALITKSPSQVFTIDDEVLVLWLMENNWDIWADMKKRQNTKKSLVQPKFTVTGDKGGGSKFGGWNDVGKERYNALYDLIERERSGQIGPVFDNYYNDTRQAERESYTRNVKRKTAPTMSLKKPIKARNSLSKLCDEKTMQNMPTLEDSWPVMDGNGYFYQTPNGHSDYLQSERI